MANSDTEKEEEKENIEDRKNNGRKSKEGYTKGRIGKGYAKERNGKNIRRKGKEGKDIQREGRERYARIIKGKRYKD